MNNFISFRIAGEDFTTDQIRTIITIRLICSGITIIGCLIIITFYVLMCVKLRCKRIRRSYTATSNISENSEQQYEPNNNYSEDKLKSQFSDNIDIDTISFESNGLNSNEISSKQMSKFFINLNKSKIVRVRSNDNNKMGIGNDLIFFLIISNLGWSIGSFIGAKAFDIDSKQDPLCIAQAFTQNFFDMSSICWNTIISYITLMGTRSTLSDLKKMNKKIYLFFLYSNLLPLIFSLGPYITDSYGPAGIWCWIDLTDLSSSPVIVWIALFNIFNWANIVYSIYALIKTSMYFSKRKVEIGLCSEKLKEAEFLGKYVFILRVFTLVLMATRLSGTLNRFYSMIFKTDSFFLYSSHSAVFSLSGFFFSILYSYFYRSLFNNCCKPKEIEFSASEGSDQRLIQK